jgi:hypothetical protein
MGKKIPRINSRIKMPIPAPGNTAAATAGGVGVKVGVIVGVLVGVFVTVGVTVDVDVGVCVEVGVEVNVGGRVFGGLGVFFWGAFVGHGMGPPLGSTQPACACVLACTLEGGIKSSDRMPNPNKTRMICGFLITFFSFFRVNQPA